MYLWYTRMEKQEVILKTPTLKENQSINLIDKGI